VVNIALTPEGRAVAEQLPAILAGVQRELLAGFNEAEEARLRDFLARIYANTRAMPGS
jgi:DNA-binding MarR family transcriptional regulator